MVNVKEVELDINFPDNGLGMVIMQPFVELTMNEPYRWQNDKKNRQIDRIVRTLEIAKQADHGCEKTHFTVFPEYAIPGLEGIRKIQEILQDNSWKNGTIVIAGVDGLIKSDYSTLCNENNTEVHQDNKPEKVRDDQWINCCITWVKGTDGSLTRWVQPKLVPAAQEELCPAHHMFEGKAVYLFKPKISIQDSELPFRFLSFVCKDWIGNVGSSSAVDAVLSQIKGLGNNDRLDIYLCFVLELNPDPNYSLFIQRTNEYINETKYISIRRSDGAILFVNNAGKNGPGYCNKFGKSGFIFHPNCSFISSNKYCPPTYSLKVREGLATCKEARFREDGACIISFKFLPPIPAIVRRSPVSPMIPINPAIIYSTDAHVEGTEEDPRTPGSEVPASVKWVNDCLDTIGFVLRNEYSHPLRNEVRDSHNAVCKEIRKESDVILCKYIEMARYNMEKEADKLIKMGNRKIYIVDNWDENEKEALKKVVHSLSIMKACKPLEVKGSPAHATIKIQDKIIDVIVVSGTNHDECFNYAKDKYPGSEQRFVVVVTHDGRSSLSERHRKKTIFNGMDYDNSRGPNITDPDSRFYHCGYQNLTDICFHSQSLEELDAKVSEIMGV